MAIESRISIGRLICVVTALWPLCAGVELQADDNTASTQTSADGARFFDTQVLPILRAHCHSCHAPRAGHELESGFDLTTRESALRGGDSGPAIDLTNLTDSALLRAIRYEDLEMPPKGKLPQSQIDILTRWVELGAPWGNSAAAATRTGPPKVDDQARAFWSFQPIRRPEIPEV